MNRDIDELLGIDENNPLEQLAAALVESDEQLLDRLVALRHEQGLTQAKVAERMGISQGAVARIEGGERNPHLSTLRRYAHAVRARVSHTVAPMGSVPAVPAMPWRSESVERNQERVTSWRHFAPRSPEVPVRAKADL